MAQLVTATSQTLCSFGLAPSVLNVLPASMCTAGSLPAATIMDNIPFVNIVPFGMCTSLANPAVAAATAAALGVLTPMPCTPVIPAPWVPGSPTVLVAGKPALTNTSKCLCAYAGVIQITVPSQVTVMAP
ncbi:MAG: DUF4280 domain-containing protein [Acidimicrobiales bacterium]